jgi:spermidine/putrescine transport system ATP-binding protein
MQRAPILELIGVTKRFGKLVAVDHVDLEVADGEFFTIVGPSGSGKTTLLRILAGMERPDSGEILLRGKPIIDLPANRRPTCLVFQSLALFPHRTVGQNIEFPLKMRGVAARQRRERALELMRLLRLPEDYYGKSVTKCSGGERQRVALARAFAYDPAILFFDEPLSAIDYRLRKTLEKELKDIHKESGKTFMYITHSLEEAMVMSDRIGVMHFGRLLQVGTPEEIYTLPRDRFVSEFMGEVNVLSVRRDGEGGLWSESYGRAFTTPPGANGLAEGHLVVRPEFMRFLDRPDDADNHLRGRVYNEYALGSRIQYQVRVGEGIFLVERLRQDAFRGSLDDEVLIGWDAKDSMLVSD